MLSSLLFVSLAVAAPPRGKDPDVAFDQVTLGDAHGCGVDAAGEAWCWGRNDRGQLGDGTFNDSAYPRPVQGLTDVVAITAGSAHTCAIRRDRSLWCWGDNQVGELGAGDLEVHTTPLQVVDLGPVRTIALGDTHTCAVTTDNTLSCWGNNLYRQLGLDGLRTAPRPLPIPGLPPIVDVAAGYAHTCALRDDGPPLCWGDDSKGQIGRDVPGNGEPLPPMPVEYEFPPDARAIEARGNQTCVLHAAGVICWGAAPTDDAPKPTPHVVVDKRGLVALSMGWGHGCAMSGGGEVTCWGDDRFGQLGALRSNGQVVVGSYGIRDARGVAAGNGESCAARGPKARTVCWGGYSKEELDAAKQEKVEVEATPPARHLVLPPGVKLLVSMEEVLAFDGARPRVVIHTPDNTTCANTRLDVVVEEKGKRVTLKIGEPYLPGGDCINSPAPAVATYDFDPTIIGRRDLVIRYKKLEDFYQVYIHADKLEIIPLQETFALWEGSKAIWRVPPGSLAFSCTDHREVPMCERRVRDGFPTCQDLLANPLLGDAPQLDRRDYSNAWFMSDPESRRISPDEGWDTYKKMVESDWRDASGCTDVRVKTWKGEVWTNTAPTK